MGGDLLRVSGEMSGALVVIFSLEGVEIGRHRRLRIDDNLLSAREIDDEIGT